MILAITGHTNIEKAFDKPLKYENGIKYDSEIFELCYQTIFKNLSHYCESNHINFNDLTLISGMARGVDEVFAILAIRNDLPLIISVPQSIYWHKNRPLSRDMKAQAVYYEKILSYKNLTKFEIKKDYNNQSFHFVNFARNQHMVDIADVVFSFKAYDSTGTDDCIKRAKKADKYGGNLL